MKIERLQRIGLRHARKTITFTGAAGAGAVGSVTAFTITGRVLVERFSAFCTTLLGEAAPTATLMAGTADDNDGLIAGANAVDIDANEFWLGGTPAASQTGPASITAGQSTGIERKFLSTDIILTVGAQNITSGVIIFDVWYLPITDNGALA